jgi:hypothetical protein
MEVLCFIFSVRPRDTGLIVRETGGAVVIGLLIVSAFIREHDTWSTIIEKILAIAFSQLETLNSFFLIIGAVDETRYVGAVGTLIKDVGGSLEKRCIFSGSVG